jgi:sedoheptulose-bisphosphatase
MVPDVYHIFVKEKGVFSSVSSEKAKAKLRLLYEVIETMMLGHCLVQKVLICFPEF